MKVLQRGVGQMSSCFQMFSRTADLCTGKTEVEDLVIRTLCADASTAEGLRCQFPGYLTDSPEIASQFRHKQLVLVQRLDLLPLSSLV